MLASLLHHCILFDQKVLYTVIYIYNIYTSTARSDNKVSKRIVMLQSWQEFGGGEEGDGQTVYVYDASCELNDLGVLVMRSEIPCPQLLMHRWHKHRLIRPIHWAGAHSLERT